MLTEEQQKAVIGAIREAEKNTSGEIRVHLESASADIDALDRSRQVFVKLEMYKTADRNAVLFYLAEDARRFAIWGDDGINRVVPLDFWDSTRDAMKIHLRDGDLVQALCTGIRMAGEQLKTYFPYQSDDVNELPDDISFG